jgi:hypothetical protein
MADDSLTPRSGKYHSVVDPTAQPLPWRIVATLAPRENVQNNHIDHISCGLTHIPNLELYFYYSFGGCGVFALLAPNRRYPRKPPIELLTLSAGAFGFFELTQNDGNCRQPDSNSHRR